VTRCPSLVRPESLDLVSAELKAVRVRGWTAVGRKQGSTRVFLAHPREEARERMDRRVYRRVRKEARERMDRRVYRFAGRIGTVLFVLGAGVLRDRAWDGGERQSGRRIFGARQRLRELAMMLLAGRGGGPADERAVIKYTRGHGGGRRRWRGAREARGPWKR
jgi:hypothetical protein